jgi:lysine-N-methylase
MSSARLTLPVIQNWDCHNCGGCCRQHRIEITAEERQRILDQKWTEADGIPANGIEASGGTYHLAHRADGACVFLNENGLCRIHAKFGEMGKPLACRVYPYVFHPAGKSVAVSLRFSCPSVVANKGRPVSQQQSEIRRIADAVVPAGVEAIPPPMINGKERVDWKDFHRFVAALDQTLAAPDVPLVTRLLHAWTWTNMVGQSTFAKLKGDRIDDFLGIICEASLADATELARQAADVTTMGQLCFRLLVAQYSRKDTAADLRGGWMGRWRLFAAAWRFSRGRGLIPPLQDCFRSIPFDSLETSFGGMSAEQEEMLTRYFRVKVQGLHFCGPAYYGVPFVEGFQSLALMLPATLWIARWLAASDNRVTCTTGDVAKALAIADHHHGFSPALGQSAARRRVRLLAEAGDLPRLILRYSR